MKRLILVLAITFVAVLAMSGSPRPASAGPAWPPLLNCPDVTGDGPVDFFDFLALLRNYGTEYPNADFYYLYDWDPNGAVDFFDFLVLLQNYGQVCPLMESQVAQATLATMQYQDCQNAGPPYSPMSGGVYVPNMGIHISNLSNMSSTFDPEQPFGLVCTETSTGSTVVEQLIGLWYVIPVESTGTLYQIPGPYQLDDEQPVGFGDSNTDEDSIDLGTQKGWHTHPNLCVGSGFLAELGTAPNPSWHDENDPVHECLDHRGGFLLVPLYGWMLHLYNFVPNPDGRFMLWNVNPDLP
jgi:hypothetical protein